MPLRSRARGAALFGALTGACFLAVAAPSAASAPVTVGTAPPGCHGWEDVAVTRLMARVRRERLYQAWSKPGCPDYEVERCTREAVEVGLHEKHDERCGGDPHTWPRVDTFRVYRRGERIDWYNLPNDTWRPFDRIHSEGGR